MAKRIVRPTRPGDPGDRRVRLYNDAKGTPLAVYDLSAFCRSPQRILVLKLDHRGDLLIALPALSELRGMFPKARITLVCGPWNAATARELGIADEIRTYRFFPERSDNWDGNPLEDVEQFRKVCAGKFDIAIDLRVDIDTRPLLQYVDADLRCGIGSRVRYPYLDVVLPAEIRAGVRAPMGGDALIFRPEVFDSRMPLKTPIYQETDFSVTDRHLIYGPYRPLPEGRLRAEFSFQLLAPLLSSPKLEIVVEVVCGDAANVVGKKRVRRLPKGDIGTIDVEFTNEDPISGYEFRIYVGGHPARTRLRFFGVAVEVLEAAPAARLPPAELHIGEQLSLLVRLLVDRVRPVYGPEMAERMANGADEGEAAPRLGIPDAAKLVVIAPISNTGLRDWPLERYIALIGLLLARVDCAVAVVGSADQAGAATQICDRYPDRTVNLAGRTNWSELAALLRRADLVIVNNSGVAHLAAACQRPTLAIYSASHQPQEWGPRGPHVRALMAVVPCSPCGFDRLELCPHDHLCMTLIEPEAVLALALDMLAPT